MIAGLRQLALCSGIFGEIPVDSVEALCFFSVFGRSGAFEVLLISGSRAPTDHVEAMADELHDLSGRSLSRELEIHRSTPIGLLIGC